MDDFNTFYKLAQDNYFALKNSDFDNEAVIQSRVNYFRMMLIKKGSFDEDKFKNWCIENNDLIFFDLAIDQIELLEKNNYFEYRDGVRYFKNDSFKKSLFHYQKKHILGQKEISESIEYLSDEVFKRLDVENSLIFEEMIKSKDGIEEFLHHAAVLGFNSFGNAITTFVQSKKKNLVSSYIAPVDVWGRFDFVDFDKVDKSHAIEVLVPIIDDKDTVVALAPKKYLYLSDVAIEDAGYGLKKVNKDEVFSRLKNSIDSVEYIKDVLGEYKSLEEVAEKLSFYYFFDDSQRELFKGMFLNGLGVEYDNRVRSTTKSNLRDVFEVYSSLNKELLLQNIFINNRFDDSFYYKLGQKELKRDDVERIANGNLSDSDKNEFLAGVGSRKIENFEDSRAFAKSILNNEEYSIETNYENLFLATKTLMIESGFFQGKHFELEADYTDEEVVDIVANSYLKDLVDDQLKKEFLFNNKELSGEFTRYKELFGAKHTNDNRQLDDGERLSELGEDEQRGNAYQAADRESAKSDGYDELSDRAGLHGESSLGDSERGDSLPISEKVAKFRALDFWEKSKEATRLHGRFKRTLKKLGEDYPVLLSNGMFHLLDGRNEFVTINETSVNDKDVICVIDYSVFGIEDIGQSIKDFKNEIEKSELYKEYKEKYFFDDNERKTIEDKCEALNLKVEFRDNEIAKFFTVTRREAEGQANSIMSYQVKDGKSLDDILFEMESFRRKYSIESEEVLDVHDKLTELKKEVSEALKIDDLDKLREIEDRLTEKYDGYSDPMDRGNSVFGDEIEKITERIIDLETEPKLEYEDLFKNSVFRDFEHTKTKEVLRVMKLSDKLSKDEFNDFRKYFTDNDLGYYSRFAKGFIVTDKSILEKFDSKQANNSVENKEVNINKGKAYERASVDLIRNAEFIKKRTGLDYIIEHHQSATFLTAKIQFDFDDNGKGCYFFQAIDDKTSWSVKERWLSGNLNRKRFIEKINETLEEEQKTKEALSQSTSVNFDSLKDRVARIESTNYFYYGYNESRDVHILREVGSDNTLETDYKAVMDGFKEYEEFKTDIDNNIKISSVAKKKNVVDSVKQFTLEDIKKNDVYQKILKDSMGGILFNVSDAGKYDVAELMSIWKSIDESEKQTAGGIMQSVMNFIRDEYPSHVETKQNEIFKYGMKTRPFGLGAFPDNENYLGVEAGDVIDGIKYHNILKYSTPLSLDEIKRYELVDFQNMQKVLNYEEIISQMDEAEDKSTLKNIAKDMRKSLEMDIISQSEYDDLLDDMREYSKIIDSKEKKNISESIPEKVQNREQYFLTNRYGTPVTGFYPDKRGYENLKSTLEFSEDSDLIFHSFDEAMKYYKNAIEDFNKIEVDDANIDNLKMIKSAFERMNIEERLDGNVVEKNMAFLKSGVTIESPVIKLEEKEAQKADEAITFTPIDGEKMFNEFVAFKEVYRNPSYFYENKAGLKSSVVSMSPQDYIAIVEEKQPDHKKYGADSDKLEALRKTYEDGIKVDIPMLSFTERDAQNDYFSQEGYHRATTALMIGKRYIPVDIRYRDSSKIPDYIKKYLDKNVLKTSVENGYKSERFIEFQEKISGLENTQELKDLDYEINKEYSSHFIASADGYSEYRILKDSLLKMGDIVEKKTFNSSAATKENDLIEKNLSDNFTIDDDISLGGSKTKFKNYIAGIEVLRKVENDEEITKEERVKLSKMPGLGTIAAAFYRENGTVAKGWEKEAEILKDTLTEEEYEKARETVLDSYYTDEVVAKAMWAGITKLGFERGAVLEPSVGVGNFFGYMPQELKANTQLIGVELDKTTAKVAQILYPKAKIYNSGYEDFTVLNGAKPNIIIGNPPYGGHKIYDKKSEELSGKTIHNYFMAKSIDNLEVGGIMAMVVSSSFMDSTDISTRNYIGQRANLLSAIRLPKGAFSSANTEVVTDIVFFQKVMDGQETNISSWLNIGSVNDTPINFYYEKHPDNLLGEWGRYSTMYRGDEPGLVAREGQDTAKLLNEAISSWDFPTDKYGAGHSLGLMNSILLDNGETISTDAREFSYFINNDELYYRHRDINGNVNFELVETKVNANGDTVALKESEIERLKAMVAISNEAVKLRKLQVDEKASENEIEHSRAKLNELYDDFVKKFGYLNSATNVRLFEDDVNAPYLIALESKYVKAISRATALKNGVKPIKESAEKADIFFKRTQRPYAVPQKADNYIDALNIALTEKGYVDLQYMGSLLNKEKEDIIENLSRDGIIFEDPHDGWVTAEEYLSGNVKQKYKETDKPENLEALKAVFPKDIESIDINIPCGATWVTKEDIEDFAKEITGSEMHISLNSYNKTWVFDKNYGADIVKKNLYSTERADIFTVLNAALNAKQIVIRDTVGEGDNKKTVVNQEETTAANDKVEAVKAVWDEWIWEDDARRVRLTQFYNDNFNVNVNRVYDGKHLKLHGKVDDSIIKFRPHQVNAVWRSVQNGRNLFDHSVGAGKTFAAIASTMEMKRLGKANKPLVVVPNHLVKQWGNDWLKLYPNAKILVPSKKDFSAKRRKILMSKIATGNYDAVIIAHSQLKFIENDKDFSQKLIKDEIKQIQNAIDELRSEHGKNFRSVKQMMNTQKKLEFKYEQLEKKEIKDDNISFLELGIDGIILDESQEFKNLSFHTGLQGVKGLSNPAGSQKAFDLYIKIRAVLEKTGNKNILFLSGTPISNSLAEMYTLQRYLGHDTLEDMGLDHFDAWVKQNASIVTDWELAASGKYKLATRLSKFINLPELMSNYQQFADTISIEQVQEMLKESGGSLDLPLYKDGKPAIIVVDRSSDQEEYFGVADEDGKYPYDSLVGRSENLSGKKPQKGEDNMLKIFGDARKASLDMRLIDESYPDFEDSKVNTALKDIKKIYNDTTAIKGVQLVFCDLSTPKGVSHIKEKERLKELERLADLGDEKAIKELEKVSEDDLLALEGNNFSVYDDMKAKLIANGVNEKEIAFIHDAKTDKQKEELFAKVNSGKIRILLGSTTKMGAGMNVQKRLVGLHHLDVPWRPSDLEQREGRIIRQGNLFVSLQKEIKACLDNSIAFDKNEKLQDVLHELNISEDIFDNFVKNVKDNGEQFEVIVNRYATNATLDSGLWEKIEAKAKFIQQIKNGVSLDREADDISGEALNAGEMKAAASGNPLMLEEMKLKTEINKLQNLKKNFNRVVHNNRDMIRHYEHIINNYEKDKADCKADSQKVKEYQMRMKQKEKEFETLKAEYKSKGKPIKDLKAPSGFEITIAGMSYDNRKEAGEVIGKIVRDSYNKTKKIGEFAGFDLVAKVTGGYTNNYLILEGENSFELSINNTIKFDTICTRLNNLLNKVDDEEYYLDKKYERAINEIDKLKSLSTEFNKESELQLLLSRHKEVVNALKDNSKPKESKEESFDEQERVASEIINGWVDETKRKRKLMLNV